MEHEFDLEPGEHTLKRVRKHWLFFVGQLIPYLFLAILPLLIPWFISLAGPAFATFRGASALGTPLGLAVLGAWWLLIWSAAFNTFTRYFLNAWIITDQRIVEMQQRGFFNREVSSLLLGRIQDVTTETHGFVRSIFDIGTINVQTAGTVERFTMGNVPDPAQLRDLLLTHITNRESSGL